MFATVADGRMSAGRGTESELTSVRGETDPGKGTGGNGAAARFVCSERLTAAG